MSICIATRQPATFQSQLSNLSGLQEINGRLVAALREKLEATSAFFSPYSSLPPVAFWTGADPFGLAEIQRIFTAYSDIEGLIKLSDNDIILPAYCSKSLNAFDHYKTLSDDWDGDGAIAPSAANIRDAEHFIRILGSQICSLSEAPRPMLDPDGIPGIFWSHPRKYMSISFYGDFSFTFLHRNKETNERESATYRLDNTSGISHILSLIEEI